ncbi:uncharacterized protein LOC116129790 [Pistacia vera]|uniref:uncharacterized protein LOC116129790 n=1 Tax=Pistacia vera TaxID=55513 RepID=UPI00126357B8|nr:uncharacterized protein LOC116129790 [Pistacia vera]
MHSTLDHPVEESAPDPFEEQVQVAQGFQRRSDPYSNTYNPGWHNNPNFSWKPQQPQNVPNSMPYRNNPSNQQGNYREQPSIQPPIQPRFPPLVQQPTPVSSSLESMMAQMLQTMQEQKSDMNASKLETQIGQIAEAVNRCEQGQLPSQVIGNPSGSSQQRGFSEQAKAVMTLRSGRELIRPEREVKVQGIEEASLGRDQAKESESEPLVEFSVQRPGKEKVWENEPSPASYIPRAPFPQCLEPPNVPTTRKSARMDEMIELFKQFNLGELKSTEVILQLADRSVKLPKGLIEDVYGEMEVSFGNRKLRLNVFNAGLGPMREDDNECFMVDAIDSLMEAHAPQMLCDDAIYTLMNLFVKEISSLSVVSEIQEFNLGELKSTEVILQLADRSVKLPKGLIEDVLVKVEELYFSVDFLVLDMEYTSSGSMPPIILGRPFPATENACINCRYGEMEVSFGNRKLRLNVFNAGLGPMREDDNECFMVDAIDSLMEAHAPQMLCDDAIYTLMNLFV